MTRGEREKERESEERKRTNGRFIISCQGQKV